MVLDTLFHNNPELKGRIIPLEYHINTPLGETYGQLEEPMYQYAKDLSEEFALAPIAPSFMHAASLSYSFNRELQNELGGRKAGWTPMPGNYTAQADTVIARSNLDEAAPVDVTLTHYWNEATGVVTGTITAVFDEAVPAGDYRVGLFVVEQSIVGDKTSGNYWQSSDEQMFIDGTMMDKTYLFPDVVRDEVVAGSIWGDTLTADAVIEVGKVYTTEFTYTVPELYYDIAPTEENIELIPFVLRYDGEVDNGFGFDDPTGEILNVNLYEMIADAQDPVGVQRSQKCIAPQLYATVTAGNLSLELPQHGLYTVTVCNSRGQVVHNEVVSSTASVATLSIDQVAQGVIFVQVEGKQFSASKRLIHKM